MDGVARCTRYAFGPNKLHLCGPDMNREVLAYMEAGATDEGLENILVKFKTLYPYLEQIAHANGLPDPFAPNVVEAYWLGNSLLEKAGGRIYYRHLKENIQLNNKVGNREFDVLTEKIRRGGLMHHSFHVMNVWQRMGQDNKDLNEDSIDKCRISWAKVLWVNGPFLYIRRKPMVLDGNNFRLAAARDEKIYRQLEASGEMEGVKAGDVITVHWGVPCEIITRDQLFNLIRYTRLSIKLANEKVV